MIKMQEAPDWKGQAKATVDYLERMCAESLSAAKIRSHEKAVLEHSAKNLPELAAALAKIIESQREDVPWDSDTAYQIMTQLMLASFFIGTATGLRPETQDYWRKIQSAQARESRSKKPEEIALRAAIEAECGTGPVAHPSKEAERILSAVNGRLQKDGFPKVSKDVVYRRLVKFPRS